MSRFGPGINLLAREEVSGSGQFLHKIIDNLSDINIILIPRDGWTEIDLYLVADRRQT